MVLNLRIPFRLDVFIRRRANYGEADEENICLGVGKRTQTIIILLTRSIPQTQVDGLAIHHDVRRIVVEHGRNVLAREGVGGVGNEQAGLTDSTVTNNDALDVLHLFKQQ